MQLEVDSIVEGRVTGITNFGVFVELAPGVTGMVHISEVATTYVKEIRDFVKENDTVKVKVLTVADGRVSLSIKKALPPPEPRAQRSERTGAKQSGRPVRPDDYAYQPRRQQEPLTFEDMMSKYKQASEEKISVLKKSTDGKRGGASRRYSR